MALSLLHLDANRAWGGGQVQALGLVRALRERGCTVQLLAQAGGELARRAEGVPVEERPLRGLAGLARLPALVRRVRELRPDLLHAHDAASQPLAAAAGRLTGVPVVATRRTQSVRRRGRLARLSYDWCARVICISEAVRRECAASGLSASRLVVIPDFVDCRHFAPRPLPAGGGAFEVASIGRLTAEKGHAVLVRAWPEVVRRVPQARLWIYGEGPERAALEAQVAACGMAHHIALPGFVADPREVLASAAVVVMPSLSEGLGVAALEAMAMGRPVVATDAGGLPESVRDGVTGRVVPKGESGALAAAIVALLQDSEQARRLGAAGRGWMVERFDRPRVVDRVLALYAEILAGGESCPD